MDIHVYLHCTHDGEVLRRLDLIAGQLNKQGTLMTKEFDAVQAEVERNKTVDGSVIALLNGLSAQIIALKNEPAKLQALADSLKASNDEVAAAVVANTPAADTPPADVPPVTDVTPVP